jgi:hypothetical protein
MINNYDLFVTRISHGKLPLQPLLYKKILSFINENYKESQKHSCKKGFQFHGDFDGKEKLNNYLNSFLNNIFRNNIEHGWLNVLGNNSYNMPHYHNGNEISLSGVFYLSNGNNINFTKDGEVFELQPKIFDYLIFPHNLVHYVLPEKRSEKRISYAFNLAPIKSL